MPISPIEKQSFGQAGAVFVNTTAATTGEFCAIQVISSAVFSALTWPELTGTASLLGTTIPAGTVIFGQISAFTLTSGAVLAYKASS